jgi:conjugal transfer pilus assembly protein TraA
MKKFVPAFLAAVLMVLLASPAFAGTDSTFSLAVTKIIGWMSGSLGVLISLLALVTALIGAVTGKLMLLTSAVGVALAFYVGPGVIQGFFTATL